MAFTLTGFDGKVAVVSGAGRMRSIGRPIALALAQAGCDVVLTGTGRAPETWPADEQAAGWRDIESVADEIRALGRRALPVVTSVADPDAVDALVAQVIAEFGRVDFLVNNAGASRGGDRVPVTELAIETWQRIINTNLNGTFYMSRAFAQQMSARTGYAAHNFAVLRHIALNLIRLAPVQRKGGIKVRRLIASTSDTYRAQLLGLV